ncbi:MAG TPA: hypothetical protein VJP87_12385 [Candidatus Acidoferrales bacterium]|nr:hypothetical protein [Candidatus Acidoferrales bacterium]
MAPPHQDALRRSDEHLDEMTCLFYVERQLERARALEVSAHAETCAACRTLLRAIERESRLLTRAMLEEDEPFPARLAAFQRGARRSMQWIWGLVFGLAATGVYALYTGYIQPWQQNLEQAGFGGSNLLNLLIFQGAFWKGWQSMLSFFEVLALLIVAGVAALFFRRRLRRGSALALVFAGFCSLLAFPNPAGATEFRKGDRITIASDQVIHSDLYATGGRIRVEGTIEGDLIIAGGDIEISGHVLGDVLSSCGSLRIPGKVDGNVRGYTGNIIIRGSVGHNVMLFGGDINIDHNAQIGGSLTTFAGHLSVDGTVGRDLLGFTGQTNIGGTVNGGAKVTGGELNIDSGAKIGGPVSFHGDHPATVSPDAKLAAPVQFVKTHHGPDYSSPHYYIWQIIWTAAYILFGLVLFALMPAFVGEAVGSAERYGASLGLGLLVACSMPIAAVIACITVVGLFVGISTLFLWYACLYFAQLIAGAMIGQWLMGRTRDLWPLIGRMAVGFVILRLFTMIPHAGGFVKAAAVFWGFGAIALAVFHRVQPRGSSGAPVVNPLPPAPVGMQPA